MKLLKRCLGAMPIIVRIVRWVFICGMIQLVQMLSRIQSRDLQIT